MTDTYSTASGDVETREEFYENEPANTAKEYIVELRTAEKRIKDWAERANKVIERYDNEKRITGDGVSRNLNIFWSNTEILKGATYSASAQPDIRRRFPDRSNAAARTAAEVLERAVQFNCDEYGFDEIVHLAVHDALVPGHGVARVRYEPAIDDESDDIYDQALEVDWVSWQDFRWSDGRSWKDVYWVAFSHLMTRSQLVQEFGKDHGDKVPLNTTIGGAEEDKDGKQDETEKRVGQRARVWEVWDKRTRKRLYVCEDYQYILREDEDPYRLREFFPCGKPLAFNRMTGSMIPIPELVFYQDQVHEVDVLTTRIDKLTSYIKHYGFYDSSNQEITAEMANLIGSDDGTFIGVPNLSASLQRAGTTASMAGVMVAVDVKPMADVVQILTQQREMAIQAIYQITGISDVLRGASDPDETATAQRLKGQFGSMRIQRRQGAVQQWIRDLFRIKAELIAEWFQPDILSQITGVDLPTEEEVTQAEQQIGPLGQQLEQLKQYIGQLEATAQPPDTDEEGEAPPPDPQQQQMQQQLEAMKQQAQSLSEQIANLQEVIEGPNWPQVMEILKSDERRSYAIDVQTDSTIQPDEAADQEKRNQFLQAFQGLMDISLNVGQQMPAVIPLLKEVTLFAMHGYKIGRTLEETVEDAFDDLMDQASQEAPDEPEDPMIAVKMRELEMRGEIERAKIDMAAQKAMTEAGRQQADIEAKRAQLAIDQMNAMTQRLKAMEDIKNDKARVVFDGAKIIGDAAERERTARAEEIKDTVTAAKTLSDMVGSDEVEAEPVGGASDGNT